MFIACKLRTESSLLRSIFADDKRHSTNSVPGYQVGFLFLAEVPMARVRDYAYVMTTGINPDQRTDALALDVLVNRCIAAAFQTLRSPNTVFTDFQREHLGQIYKSMRTTHETIRGMLRAENESPHSVDAVPVARLQLETLYSICLVLEQPSYLDRYLKHSWKQIYVRHLLMTAECQNLPTLMQELDKQLVALEELRKLAGVSDEEKATIRSEQLGEPLPPAMSRPIRQFPTPGAVLRKIREPDRKRMLSRLYFEYQLLCSFVHFSTQSRVFKGIFDNREPFGRMFTTNQLENMFQKEIAGPAIWVDFLSIVQSVAEMVAIYPGDIELRRAVTDAWAVLAERTIMGRAVWEYRAKKLLGVI